MGLDGWLICSLIGSLFGWLTDLEVEEQLSST